LLSQLVEVTLQPEQHPELDAATIRSSLSDGISAAGLVDASAIIGNFQRMVRIADGTGIPLDKPVAILSAGVREDLGINEFGSAGLTPKVGWFARWMGEKFGPRMVRRIATKGLNEA
jgi:hypothetical protein